MCNCCFCEKKEEKKVPPNLVFGVNLLREDKAWRLPGLDTNNCQLQDGATVELVCFEKGNYSIESWMYPIRFSKYYGNRVFINSWVDTFCVNPKFVFDGKKKEWVLMNCGYVCFAEQEIEHKSNHKLYGSQDA